MSSPEFNEVLDIEVDDPIVYYITQNSMTFYHKFTNSATFRILDLKTDNANRKRIPTNHQWVREFLAYIKAFANIYILFWNDIHRIEEKEFLELLR